MFRVTYMNATPFPLAPRQAIKQHEMGVVVITNPPSALDTVPLDQGFKTQGAATELTKVSDFPCSWPAWAGGASWESGKVSQTAPPIASQM